VRLLATIVLGSICYGQSPRGVKHLNDLYKRWSWQQYWDGTTDLGAKYKPGEQFPALLFERTNDFGTTYGFCASNLNLCLLYPNALRTEIAPGEDAQSAFQRFVRNNFGQLRSSAPGGLGSRSTPQPKPEDYTTEVGTIKLQILDTPQAIRERKAPPRVLTEKLLEKFGCSLETDACEYHLLIPFYDEADEYVPVYSECLKNCPYETAIVSLSWIDPEHGWWTPISAFSHDPKRIARFKPLIEKALMLEVGKPKP
jgi:hypothetical protein